MTKTSLLVRLVELRAFFLASLSVIVDFFPFSSLATTPTFDLACCFGCISLLTMALVRIFALCVAPLVRICDVLCWNRQRNGNDISIKSFASKQRGRNVYVCIEATITIGSKTFRTAISNTNRRLLHQFDKTKLIITLRMYAFWIDSDCNLRIQWNRHFRWRDNGWMYAIGMNTVSERMKWNGRKWANFIMLIKSTKIV